MDQVTSHPFFEKTDWTNLRSASPPFVPRLDSEVDTGYYDNFSPLVHSRTGVFRLDLHWEKCYDKGCDWVTGSGGKRVAHTL